ncbi:MAG: hypothetical protein ACFFF9_07330 [Candidatus Thorarchaeota archaeon]
MKEKRDENPFTILDYLKIGTWPTPERPNIIMVGSWPIPDREFYFLMELIEFFSKEKDFPPEVKKAIAPLIDFRKWICKNLKEKIRADIGAMCKYLEEGDLCTEPNLVGPLSRISEYYAFYKKYCC